MCSRIDSNNGVSSNPASGSSAPAPSGDLGAARHRCFQVPKTNETTGTGTNTDQAAQVQRQLTGILNGLM